jgi:hypothetical protein
MKIQLFSAWIASALAILPCAHAAQPWDEPFAKDTRAIAQAARQIARADNPGAIVLLDDYRYVVHADGRTDLNHRKVYRVTQQDTVDEWSSVEERYQPWYQKRPEIRARVIGPDGEIHLLDSKTVADAPAGDSDATIYSDARVVRAPLPSVAANSVVEYEIAVQETAPLLAEGVARRVAAETFVPLERFHVVVDAEAGVNLRFVTKLMPDNAVQRSDTCRAMCPATRTWRSPPENRGKASPRVTRRSSIRNCSPPGGLSIY